MFSADTSLPIDSLLVFSLAFLIDMIFGEPPETFHPTVWVGQVIAYFKPKIKKGNPRVERINGVLLGLFVVLIFAVAVYFILFWIQRLLGQMIYIAASAILLKTHFRYKVHETVYYSHSGRHY